MNKILTPPMLAGMKDLNEQQRAAVDAVLGKRARVTVVALKPRGDMARPGLRFDKVVQRLLKDLRAACDAALPDGVTALVTVTAPIRLPARTIEALEEKIRARPAREVTAKLHGNAARLRLVKHKLRRAPKFIGFVHNPDTDAGLLLDIAEEFLAAALAKGDVLVIAGGDKAHAIAYRAICEQTGCKKILMISDRGRLSALD